MTVFSGKMHRPAGPLHARMRCGGAGMLLSLGVLMLIGACANPGQQLTGGPKDEAPPVVVEATPPNYSVRFDATEISITFDEFLNPQSQVRQKLVISPVMDPPPEVTIRGKQLEVKILSELLPDRTYALNFGDAIQDLRENNKITNFSYVFSTGDELDSLELSGYVMNAQTNQPEKEVTVMLYDRDEDSLPMKQLPVYLSLTDETGQFHLKNLAAGSYKIFALKDANSNFLFDQPKEAIAFLDSLVSPPQPQKPKTDTTPPADTISPTDTIPLTDTLSPADTIPLTDTIPKSGTTIPDPPLPSIILRTFTEVYQKQYITGSARPDKNKTEIFFNQDLDSVSLSLRHPAEQSYTLVYPSADQAAAEPLDTLHLWMLDSTLFNSDTLRYVVSYTAFDSVEQPVPASDTLVFAFREQARKEGDKNPFQITANFNRSLEPGVIPALRFSEPVQIADTARMELVRTRDTLRIREPFDLTFGVIPDSIRSVFAAPQSQHPLLHVPLQAALLPDSSYSLTLLAGAFTSYTGRTNDSLKISFKVAREDEYGSILLSVENLNEPAVLQLIKGKDAVVEERRLDSAGQQHFVHLKPGKYTFWMILDRNRNGKWDTGRYLKKQQPERLLLFGKELDVKANWELEETWTLPDE